MILGKYFFCPSPTDLASNCFLLVLRGISMPRHNNHRFKAGMLCLSIGSFSEAPGTSSSVKHTTSLAPKFASAIYRIVSIKMIQLAGPAKYKTIA